MSRTERETWEREFTSLNRGPPLPFESIRGVASGGCCVGSVRRPLKAPSTRQVCGAAGAQPVVSVEDEPGQTAPVAVSLAGVPDLPGSDLLPCPRLSSAQAFLV